MIILRWWSKSFFVLRNLEIVDHFGVKFDSIWKALLPEVFH